MVISALFFTSKDSIVGWSWSPRCVCSAWSNSYRNIPLAYAVCVSCFFIQVFPTLTLNRQSCPACSSKANRLVNKLFREELRAEWKRYRWGFLSSSWVMPARFINSSELSAGKRNKMRYGWQMFRTSQRFLTKSLERCRLWIIVWQRKGLP